MDGQTIRPCRSADAESRRGVRCSASVRAACRVASTTFNNGMRKERKSSSLSESEASGEAIVVALLPHRMHRPAAAAEGGSV